MKKVFFKIITSFSNNWLRLLIYRRVFKYEIGKNVKIGKSVINCPKVIIMDNCIIRDNCHIACEKLEIGYNTSILSHNKIIGKGSFKIGSDSRIINNHFFDVWNNIEIGNESWIAGRNSQIWTHGSIHTKKGTKQLSVKIGNNVYIASGVKIAPGVTIENNNLIGLGSVVNKSINQGYTIVSGNPATIIKENINWRTHW